MWTPLENAAQSGEDWPPPINKTDGVPANRPATRRAIVGAGSARAPTAQAIESSSRRGLRRSRSRADPRIACSGQMRPAVRRGCRTLLVSRGVCLLDASFTSLARAA